MNTQRFAISVVAVFIFVFVLEFVVHGILLKETYESLAHLWRPEAEMKSAFMFISQILFSIMISFIFTRNFEGKGVQEGVRFGVMIGLLLGSIDIATYCYMPIPLTLTLSWFGASVLKCLGAGVLLTFTYKK